MIESQDIMKRLKSLGNRSRFNQNNARIIASGNPEDRGGRGNSDQLLRWIDL